MTIKLKHLDKWAELPSGQSLLLRGERKREITLEVNVEVTTTFTALEFGSFYFLGTAIGKETFVFAAAGEVEVMATPILDGGQVWYATDDGDVHAYEHAPDYKLFVKPMTRQEQTPAMRALAEKMKSKEEKRFAQQAANNAALFAQIEREREEHAAAIAEAKKPVDPPSGADGGEQPGTGTSEPAPGAGAGAGKS